MFAAVLAVVAVVACSKLPWQELDLTATTWLLVAVDGRPVDSTSPIELTFSDANRVTVTSPCSLVSADVASDTDGYALGFGNVNATLVPCSESDDAASRSPLDELLATEEWRVIDQRTIELIGPRRLTLNRVNGALVTFPHAG
jgi:heat shock protein HslJ